jgi:hypothetical protein
MNDSLAASERRRQKILEEKQKAIRERNEKQEDRKKMLQTGKEEETRGHAPASSSHGHHPTASALAPAAVSATAAPATSATGLKASSSHHSSSTTHGQSSASAMHAPRVPHLTTAPSAAGPGQFHHPPPTKAPENYQLSDNEVSSEEVDSEEEERLKQKNKSVPSWAKGESLQLALHRQFGRDTYVDPDLIFPQVTTINLDLIFQPKEKKRYHKRNSSGNWTMDRLTQSEIRSYRQDMGLQPTPRKVV